MIPRHLYDADPAMRDLVDLLVDEIVGDAEPEDSLKTRVARELVLTGEVFLADDWELLDPADVTVVYAGADYRVRYRGESLSSNVVKHLALRLHSTDIRGTSPLPAMHAVNTGSSVRSWLRKRAIGKIKAELLQLEAPHVHA